MPPALDGNLSPCHTELMRTWFVDWRANRGDQRIQCALVLFRASGELRNSNHQIAQVIGRGISGLYKIVVEWTWGIELPWNTVVGPRLRVFHGTGLVVNAESVLGCDVILRQGVCVGQRREGGPSPEIGDRVELGALAIILGDIELGDDVVVGAGSVVTKSVAAGGRVRGPAASAHDAL